MISRVPLSRIRVLYLEIAPSQPCKYLVAPLEKTLRTVSASHPSRVAPAESRTRRETPGLPQHGLEIVPERSLQTLLCEKGREEPHIVDVEVRRLQLVASRAERATPLSFFPTLLSFCSAPPALAPVRARAILAL